MRAPPIILLLSLLPTLAIAAGDEPPPPAAIRSVAAWIAEQRDIRAEFESARRWSHVNRDDKRRLYAAQDQAFALLEGVRSVDELGTDDRIRLYNAQTAIAAVLMDAELDRETCKREKVLGSHRAGLVCMTVRERRRIREMDKDMLMAPRNCRPTGLEDDPCNQR